jgi:hypothetical protein
MGKLKLVPEPAPELVEEHAEVDGTSAVAADMLVVEVFEPASTGFVISDFDCVEVSTLELFTEVATVPEVVALFPFSPAWTVESTSWFECIESLCDGCRDAFAPFLCGVWPCRGLPSLRIVPVFG